MTAESAKYLGFAGIEHEHNAVTAGAVRGEMWFAVERRSSE